MQVDTITYYHAANATTYAAGRNRQKGANAVNQNHSAEYKKAMSEYTNNTREKSFARSDKPPVGETKYSKYDTANDGNGPTDKEFNDRYGKPNALELPSVQEVRGWLQRELGPLFAMSMAEMTDQHIDTIHNKLSKLRDELGLAIGDVIEINDVPYVVPIVSDFKSPKDAQSDVSSLYSAIESSLSHQEAAISLGEDGGAEEGVIGSLIGFYVGKRPDQEVIDSAPVVYGIIQGEPGEGPQMITDQGDVIDGELSTASGIVLVPTTESQRLEYGDELGLVQGDFSLAA